MSEAFYFNPVENAKKLFCYFQKYQDLPYEEFINKINEGLNKKYTKADLERYIEVMKKSHSTVQAQKMEKILQYVLTGNSDKKLEKELNDMNKMFYSKTPFLSRNNNKEYEERKKQLLIDLKNQMNIVIDNKDVITPSELRKQNEIQGNLLFCVKNNLREIDTDMYVKFLMAYYNLIPTSKEEIHQFSETIDFFVKNLENNIYKLYHYEPKKDEELIRRIIVPGEDKLSSYYKDNIGRFYFWKISNSNNLLKRYCKIDENIESVLENENIKDFKELKLVDANAIREDEEFVYDYYKQLLDIKKVYDKNIRTLNNINDNRKKEIDNAYTKKLLFENNN